MEDCPDIRVARRDDRDAIGALWIAFLREQAAQDPRLGIADDALERWHNDYAMWLSDGARQMFVAEGGGDAAPDNGVVGFVTAEQWGAPPIYADAPEVFLTELYVAPEARRNGLGRQLVDAVRHWAEEKGAVRIRLRALAHNEAGQAFWAAQGAEPFSTVLTMELSPETEDKTQSKEPRRIGF